MLSRFEHVKKDQEGGLGPNFISWLKRRGEVV